MQPTTGDARQCNQVVCVASLGSFVSQSMTEASSNMDEVPGTTIETRSFSNRIDSEFDEAACSPQDWVEDRNRLPALGSLFTLLFYKFAAQLSYSIGE